MTKNPPLFFLSPFFLSGRGMVALTACVISAAALTTPAAAQIKYQTDPVYEKMAAEDPHPMEDLIALGEEGDIRAQFILGDLYSKGQGGLPRNIKKSREWFEKSARGGYPQSFIRLAALEKRMKNPADAYKWYTLAIETLPAGERRWAQTSRDTLVKDESLTNAQTRAARQAAAEWKKPPVKTETAPAAAPAKKTGAAPKQNEAVQAQAEHINAALADANPADTAPANAAAETTAAAVMADTPASTDTKTSEKTDQPENSDQKEKAE